MDNAGQASPNFCALSVLVIKKLKITVVNHAFSRYLMGVLIEKEVLLDVDCTSRYLIIKC